MINRMIEQVSYIAPSDEAREGLLLGTINTIYCIWGKEEAEAAYATLEDVQKRFMATPRTPGRDLNPQTDIGSEDITMTLAMEGSFKFGRN